MKHLIDIINEGNIDRCERKYREFVGMCKVYDPNMNIDDICVKKTPKNNWAVYAGDKKLFVASFNVLDDDVIDSKNIKRCDESKTFYKLVYLTYDQDVLDKYENEDLNDDELHDSANETYDINPVFLMCNNDRSAVRNAKMNIEKIIKHHPEICGGRIYLKDEIIENIFI